jgi:hypothetical protein
MPPKNEELCSIPGCRNPRAICYLEDPVCDPCWCLICQGLLVKDKKRWIRKRPRCKKSTK